MESCSGRLVVKASKAAKPAAALRDRADEDAEAGVQRARWAAFFAGWAAWLLARYAVDRAAKTAALKTVSGRATHMARFLADVARGAVPPLTLPCGVGARGDGATHALIARVLLSKDIVKAVIGWSNVARDTERFPVASLRQSLEALGRCVVRAWMPASLLARSLAGLLARMITE